MPTLIILRGLPASGKSTIAQKYVDQGFVKICFDDIHQELFGEYRFDKFGEVLSEAYKRFADAVENRQNIIIDNTHMQQKHVDAWIEKISLLEKEFHFSLNETYAVEVKYMHASIMECILRNRKRDRGNMNVPDYVILRMAASSDIPEIEKEFNAFSRRVTMHLLKDESFINSILEGM